MKAKESQLCLKYREAFNKFSSEQFEYGQMDCVIFVAKCIEHVYGVDHVRQFCYHSKTSAYRMIKLFGGFAGLIDYVLGEPKYLNYLETGDVVLCEDEPNGEFLGIYMVDRVIAKTQSGAVAKSSDIIKRAWSCRT